jgi:peptide-methionine (S)-S-oxide reductase
LNFFHRLAVLLITRPKRRVTSLKKSILMLLMCSYSLFSTQVFADKATFAGGCFWCMESDFEKLEGVSEVISGFTGGELENPTYNGDHTGHYEAVEVIYDPAVVSYKDLLAHYWVNIDPFDSRGQFCDKGPSYLSAVFVANEQQRQLAEASKRRVVDEFPQRTVVTPILETSVFYPIKGRESIHQDYYKKNPVRYNLYRWNCGRDSRLTEIWGSRATH